MAPWLAVTVVAISAVLAYLAYSRILGFPYLFDDPIHLRWMEGRDLLDIWTDAEGMQHYRPLVFTLWHLSSMLFGPHNAAPLHLLSLLLHVASASLVGWLAYMTAPTATEKGRAVVAVAAVALFATYPFSYQVLPSPGSQSKPLSTLFILVSCWCYWRARAAAKSVWLLPAAVSAVAAPFAYEAAITSGGYLLLMELALWRRGLVGKPSARAIVSLGLGLPFLAAWRLVPSSYDPLSFPGWEALWQSSVYFLQGLTWPIALTAKPLMRVTHLSDGLATAIVVYPASAVLIGLLSLRKRWTLLVTAFGWLVLSLVVQWLTLSFRYVIDGPRLLYTASAGMALLWAQLALLAWEGRGRWRTIGRAAAGLSLVAIVGWGTGFVRQRMDMIARGVAYLTRAAEEARLTQPDDVLLFVNAPAWLAPRATSFALGHEGYVLLPPYYSISVGDHVYASSGIRRETHFGSLPDIRESWSARIGYHGGASGYSELGAAIRQADRVYVPVFGEDGLGLHWAGGILGGTQGERELPIGSLASYADKVSLESITTSDTREGLRVELLWRMGEKLDAPHTVFVHLYSPEGELLAQADGYPMGGTFPLDMWEAGDVVHDVRYLTLPDGSDTDGATLGVGLYRPETGARVPALDADGVRLLDDVSVTHLDGSGVSSGAQDRASQ